MKLLLALVLFAIIPTAVNAQEITVVVQLMPRQAVIERCAAETVPEWGCVDFLPATDNPNKVWCLVFVVKGPLAWEEEARVEVLRPQCGAAVAGQGR